MARQIPLWTGAAIFLLVVGSGFSGPAPSPGAAAGKIIAGEIHVKEISGAAFLPGDRLLVVADDLDGGHAVFQLEHATERLKTHDVEMKDFKPLAITGKPRNLDDLEDVAWDRQSSVVLVTSHSLNKKGKGFKEKPERFAIARLPLGKDGATDAEVAVLDLQVPEELKESMARTPAKSGFNIEGAALGKDGHLFLGLTPSGRSGSGATAASWSRERCPTRRKPWPTRRR